MILIIDPLSCLACVIIDNTKVYHKRRQYETMHKITYRAKKHATNFYFHLKCQNENFHPSEISCYEEFI